MVSGKTLTSWQFNSLQAIEPYKCVPYACHAVRVLCRMLVIPRHPKGILRTWPKGNTGPGNWDKVLGSCIPVP